jgi:HlyD family secretion protein
MAENQLFRRAAIEKLASPERLDVLMKVTSPKGWVAVATIAFILVCAIIWSVAGSIPTRVDAQGVLVTAGDPVTTGAVIAVLEPPSPSLEPVVFVNPTIGKRIKPGMEAQISPATVKREEYGFMKGTVRFVGNELVTPEAAMSIVANQPLVQELIGSGAALEMRAALKPNQQAASGYEWSSSGGPPFRVDSGTRVTVSVVIDRKRPISYILPILRSRLASN